MRLFDSDIKRLRMLTSANFKKQTCATCGEDFYSFRDCLYCHQSCKQMAYRRRLLNTELEMVDEIPPKIDEELIIPKQSNLKKVSFDDKELDEKLEKYTNNLKQLKYGRE